MAIFTGAAEIGGTAANESFVANSRIWAGGGTTYSSGPNDFLRATGTGVISADSCALKVTGAFNDSGIWRHSFEDGHYNFSNVQIHTHDFSGNAGGNSDVTFTDVTWVSTGLTSQATFGNYGGATPTPATYIINGFNIWFNPATAGGNQATGVFFPAVVTSTSQLNGISLWNGRIGDGILGAALTFRGQIYSGLQSGPIGFVPPPGDGGVSPSTHRVLYRCESVPANQFGFLLGYDYRGIHGQSGAYIFGADNGGNHWIINPLQGTPSDSLGFSNVFTSNTASTAIVAVGNRPSSTAADVTIVSGDGSDTMYAMPSSISPASPPSTVASNIITLESAPFGILFSNQIATIATGGFTETAVEEVNHKSYVTYSWQQLDWGTPRTILTPGPSIVDAASNTAIDNLRNSGSYPDVNQNGFVTALDINEEVDAVTAGFARHSDAVTALHGSGRAANARDAVASIKAARYATITTGGILGLEYTISGLEADFGAKNLVFIDVNGTPDPSTATITIPTTSLDYDAADTITAISANEIRVGRNILNTTNEKAALECATSLDLDGALVQNFTGTAPTISAGTGSGTPQSAEISGSVLTATNINDVESLDTLGDGNTYTPTNGTSMNVNYTGGVVADSVYTAEDLLGDNYVIGSGNVVITSTIDIILETADTNVIAGTGVTPQVPSDTITYEVPASLRNGVFAVKNIDTGNVITAPVVVDAADAATFRYLHSSSTYTIGDQIRIYWRPNSDANNGYDTTIFDLPTIAIGVTEIRELSPVSIPSVLWEDLFPDTIVDDVGSADMTMIEDGDNPELDNIDRAEIQYINTVSILNDPNEGAVRTLYVTMLSLNDDVDYIQRMIEEDLTGDYIQSAGSEVLIDGAYCYLDSGDANTQTITAVTNSNLSVTQEEFIPNTFDTSDGAGNTGTTPTVVVLPNPLGATPGQIAAAVATGTGNIRSNQTVLLTAIQRGSVKSATYSAGELT